MTTTSTCPVCNRPLPSRTGRGRPRKYHDGCDPNRNSRRPVPQVRRCACGCGEVLPAAMRADARFLTPAHQQRDAYRRRQARR